MRRAFAIALLALIPSFASAQEANVVVMGLGGDASAEVAREAREHVAAALGEDGLRVLPDSDLAIRISPARLGECRSSSCAWSIGRELGVSMVAAVTTWTREGQASSLTVSLIMAADRSHTATAEVSASGLAGAAREAVTGAQASRRRALIVEGTSAPVEVSTPEIAQIDDPNVDESPLRRDRALEEWILPTLLGVVGLALIGTAVYAMLEEQCDLMGRSGVCLRGTRPNYGLGVTFTVLGILSLAGALVWLVVGGQPPSVGNVNVVFGPDGVGVRF